MIKKDELTDLHFKNFGLKGPSGQSSQKGNLIGKATHFY